MVNLTGINSKMLRNAPKFYEVAKRIVEITEDCIIVAHNAEFDYRILRTEFKRLGFEFKRKSICTVELAQKLMPEQESFSLGKLTRALGIPVSDRHRANGDAMATVTLFKMLLNKDVDKSIIQEYIKANKAVKINDSHKNIIDNLPAITGVYYMHDKDGKIIYIGRSKNIKHRVSQHLTNTNAKSKKIQLLTDTVTYESTGNELVALLKESEAVKRHKPKFNRVWRHTKFSHALYSFVDDQDYINLKIDQYKKESEPISTYGNYQSAKSHIQKLVQAHGLCLNRCGIPISSLDCGNNDSPCNGNCHLTEPTESYNPRVKELIDQNSLRDKTIVIVDKGRNVNERSAILVKNGELQGVGFTDLNHQLNNLNILQSVITPMKPNHDTEHIIQSYLRRTKNVKILNF